MFLFLWVLFTLRRNWSKHIIHRIHVQRSLEDWFHQIHISRKVDYLIFQVEFTLVCFAVCYAFFWLLCDCVQEPRIWTVIKRFPNHPLNWYIGKLDWTICTYRLYINAIENPSNCAHIQRIVQQQTTLKRCLCRALTCSFIFWSHKSRLNSVAWKPVYLIVYLLHNELRHYL